MAKKVLYTLFLLLTIAVIGVMLYISTIVKVKNPSKNDITVKVDDMRLLIKKGEEVEIKLYPGMHKIMLDNKDLGTFEKGYFDARSFINPTRSTYLLESRAYYDEGTELPDTDPLPNNTVFINNKKYVGPYSVHDNLYMQNNYFNYYTSNLRWDYDETKPFPSLVTTRENALYIKIKQLLGFNHTIEKKLSLIR